MHTIHTTQAIHIYGYTGSQSYIHTYIHTYIQPGIHTGIQAYIHPGKCIHTTYRHTGRHADRQ